VLFSTNSNSYTVSTLVYACMYLYTHISQHREADQAKGTKKKIGTAVNAACQENPCAYRFEIVSPRPD